MRSATDHVYGGEHTPIKNAVVRDYLNAFCTALRPHFNELWYIDAFAGTGEQTVRIPEVKAKGLLTSHPSETIRRPGSAQIAIDTRPPFDLIVLIDEKPAHVSALEELRARNPERRIVVIKDDANTALRRLLRDKNWSSIRAVTFLDPYGMHVE